MVFVIIDDSDTKVSFYKDRLTRKYNVPVESVILIDSPGKSGVWREEINQTLKELVKEEKVVLLLDENLEGGQEGRESGVSIILEFVNQNSESISEYAILCISGCPQSEFINLSWELAKDSDLDIKEYVEGLRKCVLPDGGEIFEIDLIKDRNCLKVAIDEIKESFDQSETDTEINQIS
jgi:hypothetical protein